jgi:hypothetical protein
MESEVNQYTILVACHLESETPLLRSPYREVGLNRGGKKPFGYEHYVSNENGMLVFPEAWSEIEVLLHLAISELDASTP